MEYLHVPRTGSAQQNRRRSVLTARWLKNQRFVDNKKRLTTNTAGELFTGIVEQVPIMDYSARFYQNGRRTMDADVSCMREQ